MKRTIIIVSAAAFMLILLSIWGYLFVFGAPEGTRNIFANFGGGDEQDFPQGESFVDTLPFSTSGEDQALRQLTTRPIAGMAFIGNDTVRYAELGTGHIYDISLTGGEEVQVTNTTFTRVISAQFDPSGNNVIFEAEVGDELEVIVGTIVKGDEGMSELVTIASSPGISNAILTTDGSEVIYTFNDPDGAGVYAFDMDAGTDALLLTVPFNQAVVSWGSDIYVYTRPTAALMGYVYRIAGESLEYLRYGGMGMTAFGYPEGYVTTEILDGEVRSYAFEDAEYPLPLALFPEKCTAVPTIESTLMCAATPSFPSGVEYPDDWYKGKVSFDDMLWSIHTRSGEAVLLANPSNETGRQIDVQRIIASGDGMRYLLINKNDNALWLFEPS